MKQEDFDLIDDLLDEPCKDCGEQNHNLGAYRNDGTDTMWVECFQCGYEYNSGIS
jgi:hypothetical protein